MVEQYLVAILGNDASDKPVGAGVLISDDRIITCAHVVNRAIGRPLYSEQPLLPEEKIRVKFHAGIDVEAQDAWIGDFEGAWSPPPATRGKGADICLLRFSGKLPAGVKAAEVACFTDLAGSEFKTAGYPKDLGFLDLNGEIGMKDRYGLSLLRPNPVSTRIAGRDPEHRPFHPPGSDFIRPGFSGAPVVVRSYVVGLVTECASGVRENTAYMIPADNFPEQIRAKSLIYRDAVSQEFPHVENLIERIRTLKNSNKGNRDLDFDLRIRICDDFENILKCHQLGNDEDGGQIFEGRYSSENDVNSKSFAMLLKQGRPHEDKFILQSPGGSGKTSFLRSIILAAASENLVPFFIDFSKPRSIHFEHREEMIAENSEEILQSWFHRYASFGTCSQLLELANRKGTFKPLLIIDSLNQISNNLNIVIEMLESLASSQLAGCAIVVAERMVERPISESFQLSTIRPLPVDIWNDLLVKSSIDIEPFAMGWHSILSSPLFLDLLRSLLIDDENTKVKYPNRSHLIKIYLRDICKLQNDDLEVLANTAFRLYSVFNQTAASFLKFKEILGEQFARVYPTAGGSKSVDQFIENVLDETGSGLVTRLTDGKIEFRHQLIHDYLASLKVVSVDTIDADALFDAPTLQTLTLDTASSDAAELAVESLSHSDDLLRSCNEPISVVRFLNELHDWNYWIALQCVMSFDRRALSSTLIPDWMRHSIYASNLEKLFDPFLHTAQRAEKFRKQISVSVGQNFGNGYGETDQLYLNCKTPEELRSGMVKISCDIEAPPEFLSWLHLFSQVGAIEESQVDLISAEPLLGWATSNMLRRLRVDEAVYKILRRDYEQSKNSSGAGQKPANYRWRIVHAFGTAPAEQVGETLLAIAFDVSENRQVRYGALRSAIEVAARDASDNWCVKIFDGIYNQMDTLFSLGDSCGKASTERIELTNFANLRLELRRSCSLNEAALGRDVAWCDSWYQFGLPRYKRILRKGEDLARKFKLTNEAEKWTSWRIAVERVLKIESNNWEDRRSEWFDALSMENGEVRRKRHVFMG